MGRKVTLQTLWQFGLIPQLTDRLGVSYWVVENMPMDWTFELSDELWKEFDMDGPKFTDIRC